MSVQVTDSSDSYLFECIFDPVGQSLSSEHVREGASAYIYQG